MSFRHPANRRGASLGAAQKPYGDGMFFFTRPVGAPDEISEGEYGDGMFFFTRPVGAPDDVSDAEYGDGAFFFTQPVGAPQSIRPGTYGAAKAADIRKMGAGLRASLTKPSGGRAAPAISADTYKTFETAAINVGARKFWRDFWFSGTRTGAATGGTRSGGSGASSTSARSDESQAAYANAVAQYDAARAALDAATTPLLKGVSSDTAVRQALAVYMYALIDQGWYEQAFRNLSGSTRKTDKLLTDTILRDIASAGMTSGVGISRGYLLRDAQTAFTADDYLAALGGPPKRMKGETKNQWYDRSERWTRQAKSYAQEIFSSDFEKRREALRSEQVGARSALASTISNAKKAFEAARSAAYAEKTANLPTQQGGGTRRTTDTTTGMTMDTTDDTTADTMTEGTVAPDITGGPPSGAQTLEYTTGEEQKVGFLTPSGAGEESFFSKNKLWIGLGSVALIGGGYWWYTQKYLPTKAGR